MRSGLRLLQVCLLVAFGTAVGAIPSQAQPATSEFRALLDLDNNPSTGCTVVTADGPFTGVEQVLITTVDLTQTPPAVISVATQACTVPSTNTFGAVVPITSPFATPWPVGVGNGTGGADVVETYLPLTGLSVGNSIRMGFTAQVVGGTGPADADLTTTGVPGAPAIILSAAPIAAVPTLGTLGLVLLGLLVAACALQVLRRRGSPGGPGSGRSPAVAAVAAFLLLTIGLGIAWADITPNGNVTDWAGIPPIAVDVVGDAPPNADLVAEFATIQNNILFIRFDARIVGLPTVVSTTPTNGATGVAGSSTVTVNFNEPVAIDASSFTLECPTGTPETFTVSPAAPGNASSFTLTPTATLPPGVTCSVHVIAAHVHDASGLTPAANYPFSFTTDGPPAVTSTSPANGATGIALKAPVTINFSKAVNATTASFKLECPVGTPEAFTVSPVSPVGGSTSYTLTPAANLPAGTVCTVTALAAQITDALGTHPTADYVFSYTTDVAPTVTSTSPANGATGVAVNGTVTVNFSAAVTVTATAFKLECPVGTPETFTIAPAPPPAGGATSFTLTPSAKLPAGTTCTVTVVASQVKDVTAGTNLAADYSFSFTTDVAPTVTSTTPANGATQQAPSTSITVVFSKAVNVTASAFKLECPVGTPEAFTVTPTPPGGATSFTLTPATNLPVNTTCTVTVVASQVTDVAAGTNLPSDYVFSFGVGDPPAVTSTTPANGATSVLATTAISVTFNKAVNITASAFTLECPVGTPEAFTVSPTPPGGVATYTLTPSAALPAGTVCTVTVAASQVTDTVNNLHPTADYVFSFTIDTPPTVTGITPANGATSVPVNSVVTFTFDRAVHITSTSFDLECPTGTPVAFTVTPAAPGGATSYTLTPSASLPAGTTCTATAVAAQITDLAGTHLAADVSSSFTVDTAPTVTATSPANGATAVALNATVSFTFSKAVDVTASAFKLECPTGTPEGFTLSPTPPGAATTFTLTPSSPLPAGVTCTATAVASQITDLLGTPLAADFAISFTTDTPPTVTATAPANGATQVPPSTTITVSFSKTVNVTATAFKLECPTGTPETFTLAPAPPGAATSFTLTPTATLPVGTVCTVTVVASQVTDTAAGTHLAADYVFSFTTGTPPTVTSTTPTNGATSVLATTAITVTFSKPVNVTAPGFKLECPTGTPEAFTLTPAAPGGVSTFTLTPSAALPAGATCTVTVIAADVADTVGNVNLAADYVFSFTVDTPPTVTATSPANGATSVPLNSAVSFTFSKAVNVSASAFKLECPTGTPEAFTLSPAPPGGATVFTLTPTASLPAGVVCTATAVAAQIADLAGTHLAADDVISFTTDTAPTVTSTTPANGATAVLTNSTISITFSKAVTVTGTAFKLECPTGTPEAFTVSPASPATTFTLTPTANLPAGAVCTVTVVATQVTDAAATPLAANYVFSFTVDTPPTVTATAPTNGATQVPPSSAITVSFNKAVNVTSTAFKLECPTGTPEAFTLAPAPPGGATSFTLTPTATLPVATVCTVTVVASQVTDLAGTNLASNFVFSFTTGTPPTVTATTPANGATAVLATSPISITFSKPVNVTAPGFKLECPTGTPQAFTISPTPPGGVATFTLTPSAALPASTTCTVTVIAADIADTVGNIPLAADYVFSFTVDTPPTVTATSPANGATAVPLNTTVSFTFNKAVNVTSTAFKLECPTGTPEAFTLSPAPPGGTTTYTLTPTANLPAGTVCTATAVATQITDLAGTHLAANDAISFTTDTPPTVTSTTPANGATSVLANSAITITFSKSVNVTGTAFKLECPTGTPEAFTVSPASPATTFTLTPTSNLPSGAVCTVTVVANQVTDAATTPMAANFVFSFTVDTPPTVSSTTPANGASNFVDTGSLTVTFNKAVNVTGTAAFTIACPTGSPQTFTLSPAAPGGVTTFTLTPTTFLPPNVTCTATVVASQVSDLAGTQMAANYVWTFATVPPPPVATADTYPQIVIGNVSVNSSLIPYSVTSNDTTQAGTTFTITAYDTTSANGGNVSMTTSGPSMGQFTYNPPAGFVGTDTFTYTITNTGGSATGTVSLTVSGIIWFINNNASAGDGRLSSPFNSLAAFAAVNDGVGHHPAANANIFLYDSATAYTGPLTLLNGQKLIGQDATSSLSTITGLTPGSSSAALPATGGGTPNNVKITSSGNTVTLGSGNTVWGLFLGNSTGTALTGASVGSLKLRDLSITTTGAAVSLANGALDAILNTVSSGAGTHGIALTTTTGSFDVEGGGPSDPANPTKGRTTARNGGGTLTLGSGGTISGATSSGVLLSSATNVTLRNLVIQNNGSGINNGGDGINASNGSNLTLDNDLISGQTTNNGLHATGVAGVALAHTELTNNASSASADGTHVADVRFDECTGTITAANSLFHNSRENIVDVTNSNATTLTLTVTNSQFSDTATASPGNAGLQLNLNNTAAVTLSVDSSTFLRNFSRGVQYLGDDSSSGGFTVTNSTFDANAIDIDLAHQGLGKAVTFNIAGNTLRQTTGGLSNAIAVTLGAVSNSTTTLVGKIQNNTIGNAAVADSGSNQGSGIVVEASGAGTLTAAVLNNTVVQVDNEGLNASVGQGSGTLNLTVTGNHFAVDTASPNSDFGMLLVSGLIAGDAPTACMHVATNVDTGNAGNGGSGIALATEAGTPIFNLQGYTGAANNSTQIASFLDGSNTDSPTPAFILAGAGTIKAAPANCPTPP